MRTPEELAEEVAASFYGKGWPEYAALKDQARRAIRLGQVEILREMAKLGEPNLVPFMVVLSEAELRKRAKEIEKEIENGH